jgi:predicted permease
VKEEEGAARMQQAILEKLAALPGVASVGFATSVPLEPGGWHDPIFAADRTYTEGQLPPLRLFQFVTPGARSTLGTPLVAGRDFTWSDVFDRLPVVMVSENVARELWGSPAGALGKRVREGSKSAWREVVGVVADVHYDGLDQKASSTVYYPVLLKEFEGDGQSRSLAYFVRSPRAGSEGLLKEIREAVWSVNPNLPLASVRTLETIYERSMARTSFTVVMLGLAGGMALLIGVVGIYGVVSYAVSQRTREIGIRMALGAQREELTRMFVRHGLLLAAIGAGFGLVAALALSRVMGSLLFGVGAMDPATFVAVAALLVGAAGAASYVPARRVADVDPVQALRAE